MNGKFLVLAAFAAGLLGETSGFQKALILPRLDEDGVRRVRENGYDGAELRLHGETESEAEAARALADRSGVKLHSVMANGWYAFDDETKYEAALAQAKSEIALAKAYGVDTLLVVSGSRRSEERRYLKLTDEEQSAVDAATRRAFAELVPIAEKAGVCIALEFVWNNAWADPDAYAAFVRSFDSPWVKIYLDLGNGLKFAPVAKWIAAAGKDIRRVHIKDFLLDHTTPRGGEFVPIATGDIDFAEACAALRKVGYDGWVSIESEGWSDAEHARLVDWFFAGAPSGDAVGNWTFDLPNDGNRRARNERTGWLGIERTAGGFSSRCLWRSASPWRTPNTEAADGVVRIVRLNDGRKAMGECDYDIIRGRVVGDELFAGAFPRRKDGATISNMPVVFRGRRLPAIGAAPELSSLVYGERIDLLKDGLDGWELMSTDRSNGWSFADGVLSNAVSYDDNGRRTGAFSNIISKRSDFLDFRISYDVKMPKDGNSGVYLRGIYEIQSRESFGMPPDSHNMGAYYGRATPSVAAEKPADEWQHVEAVLARRHLWVWLNGVEIITAFPVEGITGGAISSDEFSPGPIYIQGDHSNASYRNMILEKIEDDAPTMRMRLVKNDTERMEVWKANFKAIAEHPGCCDEVWFSTGCGIPDLADHRRHAEILKVAADDLRSIGVIPSLQFQATLGHADYKGTDNSFAAKTWGGWTDWRNVKTQYVNCPRQPAFLDYVRNVSRIYAPLRFGSMWIDDDLRLTNHKPADNTGRHVGCWCDKCLADFNAESGGKWTRETLGAAVDADDALYARWREFSIRSLCGVVRAIDEVFCELSPDTMLAQQQGSWDINIDQAKALLKTHHEVCRRPVGYRLAGGGYWDDDPNALLEKSIRATWFRGRIGNPEYVCVWTPEIESWPRTYYSRSTQGILMEGFVALMYGSDSISYFVSDARKESPELYGSTFWKGLSDAAPVIHGFLNAVKGCVPVGYTLPGDPQIGIRRAAIPVLSGVGRSVGELTSEEIGLGLAKMTSAQVQALRESLDRRAGGLPAIVASPFRGLFQIHVESAGESLRTVSLLNTTIDVQNNVCVRLRNFPKERSFAVWHELRRQPVEMPVVRQGEDACVTIPCIGAWNGGYVDFSSALK